MSVADARRFAQGRFARWELDRDAAADAVLLVSELVTNAVVHAGSGFLLSVAVAEGVLEVGVTDDDPRPPRPRTAHPPVPGATPRPHGLDDLVEAAAPGPAPGPAVGPEGAAGSRLLRPKRASDGGRGLVLVDRLADEWGVARVGPGKQVWFRLDAGQEWPYRTSCRCDGQDLGRVRLSSGRQVFALAGPWDDDPDPPPTQPGR